MDSSRYRWAALNSASANERSDAIKMLDPIKDRETLEGAARSEKINVLRRIAVEKLHNEASIATIEDRAQFDDCSEVRTAAILKINGISSQLVLEAIAKGLPWMNADERVLAVKRLGVNFSGQLLKEIASGKVAAEPQVVEAAVDKLSLAGKARISLGFVGKGEVKTRLTVLPNVDQAYSLWQKEQALSQLDPKTHKLVFEGLVRNDKVTWKLRETAMNSLDAQKSREVLVHVKEHDLFHFMRKAAEKKLKEKSV